MPDQQGNHFSHIKPGDTTFASEGLRDFCLYRDLGIADAISGNVIAQLVKAKFAPKDGTQPYPVSGKYRLEIHRQRRAQAR